MSISKSTRSKAPTAHTTTEAVEHGGAAEVVVPTSPGLYSGEPLKWAEDAALKLQGLLLAAKGGSALNANDLAWPMAALYEEQARFNIAAGRCTLHEAAEILNIDTENKHKSILKTMEAAAKSGLLPVYARGQRNRYVYEEYARMSVFETETRCADLNNWLDANEPDVEYRFSVPLEVALITAPAQHTATAAPVVPAERREKKPSIETVALDYMRAEFRQGQFQSAAKFHEHLIRTAGLNNSPFEMGTGTNARKLFCPAASSFYDAGTLGKSWAKIRAV